MMEKLSSIGINGILGKHKKRFGSDERVKYLRLFERLLYEGVKIFHLIEFLHKPSESVTDIVTIFKIYIKYNL